MYEITDKKLLKLKKKIVKLFSRYKATMSFDEMNVINKSKKLYKELDDYNKEIYYEIANEYYKEINPGGKLNKKWVLALLLAYDPITKYVYEHEVDRKRARFAESIIASKSKNKEFKTALNLWLRQANQYGINVTDEARIQAYKDIGVKRMMWNTNLDGKECKICRERHKKIYPINNLPTKPHYNCRCYYTPIKDE